jgi:nucleotide-binding universal stress UspA family protein
MAIASPIGMTRRVQSNTAGARRRFAHILCPVDFSRHSRVALRYANVLAQQSGGKLTVMTVNDPMLAAADAAALTRDSRQLDSLTMRELRRFVSTTLSTATANATLEVVVGYPADQIDRIARRRKVDLVVMGTHGLSGPKKCFFGSTTESLFRRSKVPVLAVPGKRHTFLRDPACGKTILAPIDLEGTGRTEISRVMDAAGRLGGKTFYLHVVKPVDVPTRLNRQRVGAAAHRIRQLLGRSAATRSCVVTGDPVARIEEFAARKDVKAIVMTVKRHGLVAPRRGSIAYRVVCARVAPVLALPPRRERVRP